MTDLAERQSALPKSCLGLLDTLRVGSSGLRSRRLRSALSALGITIGIAALISVLGLSASGSADLIRELDELGTNLLTIEAGQGFKDGPVSLPENAAAMIRRITPVYEVATASKVPGGVHRNDLVDEGRTRGITIVAADLNLVEAQQGSMRSGVYLSEVTSEFPAAVLGTVAAERLGIRDMSIEHQLWLGEQ
jgi:putative ABC transport system permease protein